ncbi:MAG TPA: TIGR00282 family metallophosphoesterase [Deltaproteobacteria bacterium]|nr:TIGR00282 family metallophosphoesterase [Deltaproteobacteria bacterium]HCP46633.1 TIGR00282 family metallophosphoesterase [Deltaproteobacteria bacterium]
MKILCIGDIFGRPGRRAVRACLDEIVDKHDVSLVIANAENAAGGFGLTPSIADELFGYGIHVLTGGNHTWDKREVGELLEDNERVLRPHNYPRENPGSGMTIIEVDDAKVAVLNLQGRIFMPTIDCPFQAVDRLIDAVQDEADLIVVDLHAEATSEKMAMAWHLDGRATVLVGTHTHVQTADEQVFPKGLAYMSDLGMTGPHRSIIGVRVEQSLGRFLNGRPSRFEAATGDVRFHGLVIDADERSGRARSVCRIQVHLGET